MQCGVCQHHPCRHENAYPYRFTDIPAVVPFWIVADQCGRPLGNEYFPDEATAKAFAESNARAFKTPHYVLKVVAKVSVTEAPVTWAEVA
jgi:hypothetical protein